MSGERQIIEIGEEQKRALAAMPYHDRIVLREWLKDSPYYTDLIAEIDRLNDELMVRYGAAKKED
jgi:hypothetical protein